MSSKARDRRLRILDALNQHGEVHLGEMCDQFQVSEGTIRADLAALQVDGRLIRTHGGARSLAHLGVRVPLTRALVTENSADMQRIAERASELVADGDTVLLCDGEITRAMAPRLLTKRNLTIVTNSLEIAFQLTQNSGCTVLLTGGQLGASATMGSEMGALNGSLAVATLQGVRVDKAFIGCDGVTHSQGFASNEIELAQLKAAMVQCAQTVVTLALPAAVGRAALMSFYEIGSSEERTTHLITASGAAAQEVAALRSSGLRVTLCGEGIVQICLDSPPEKRWRIGFANLNEREEFAIAVRRGLEAAAQFSQHVELLVADNDSDPRTALANARRMIDAGIDVLIEYQVDELTNQTIMDMCRTAHVPVIAVDIPAVGATFFGADNYRAGRMAGDAAARWIRRHWQGRIDKVVVLEQRVSGSLPAARIQGQLDVLEAELAVGDKHIVRYDTHGDLKESRKAAMQALHNIPWGKRVLFVGMNAASAMGALQAVEVLERQRDTVVVSQNINQGIRQELERRNPVLIGAVDYFPEEYGKKLLRLATDLLEGIGVPPAVHTNHALVVSDAAPIATSHDERGGGSRRELIMV
ncbi:MAG: substrate-binding domain-containing protein [Chloroflexi bacterium]|nr:substrate-binding domain-containing protein [Chloroflexota bacterium]